MLNMETKHMKLSLRAYLLFSLILGCASAQITGTV